MATFLSKSRYEKKTNTSDNTTTVIGTRKTIYAVRFYLYTSKEGDTFDLLANRILGDPTKWWSIADINPQIPFPDQIPVGTTIRIPRP